MGFFKTIIFGAKCDICEHKVAYRFENTTENITKTGWACVFEDDGWMTGRKVWRCPECAEKWRKSHGKK